MSDNECIIVRFIVDMATKVDQTKGYLDILAMRKSQLPHPISRAVGPTHVLWINSELSVCFEPVHKSIPSQSMICSGRSRSRRTTSRSLLPQFNF